MPADGFCDRLGVSADRLRAVSRAYESVAGALESGHRAAAAQGGEVGMAFGGFEQAANASAELVGLRDDMDDLVGRHMVETLRQMARRMAETADTYEAAEDAGVRAVRGAAPAQEA